MIFNKRNYLLIRNWGPWRQNILFKLNDIATKIPPFQQKENYWNRLIDTKKTNIRSPLGNWEEQLTLVNVKSNLIYKKFFHLYTPAYLQTDNGCKGVVLVGILFVVIFFFVIKWQTSRQLTKWEVDTAAHRQLQHQRSSLCVVDILRPCLLAFWFFKRRVKVKAQVIAQRENHSTACAFEEGTMWCRLGLRMPGVNYVGMGFTPVTRSVLVEMWPPVRSAPQNSLHYRVEHLQKANVSL